MVIGKKNKNWNIRRHEAQSGKRRILNSDPMQYLIEYNKIWVVSFNPVWILKRISNT